MTVVFTRRRKPERRRRRTGQGAGDSGGREEGRAVMSQEMPDTARSCVGQEHPSPEALEGAWPRRHLDFRLQPSMRPLFTRFKRMEGKVTAAAGNECPRNTTHKPHQQHLHLGELPYPKEPEQEERKAAKKL